MRYQHSENSLENPADSWADDLALQVTEDQMESKQKNSGGWREEDRMGEEGWCKSAKYPKQPPAQETPV